MRSGSLLAAAAARRDAPEASSPPRVRTAPPVAAGLTLALLALGGCGTLPPAPERTVLAGSDIGLKTLTQPPAPPEIVARSPADPPLAAAGASEDRLAALAGRERAERRPGPEIAFFFESPLGRAYLASGRGKALARGAPADSCPALGASLDQTSPRAAAEQALARCLDARPAGAELRCGCRLIAAGDVLLAPPETFAYARAIGGRLIARLDGDRIDAPVVIDGPDHTETGARGPRRVLLRSPSGPVGALALDADGGATLDLGARRLSGAWAPEGFRRGRLAGAISLSGADGSRALVLIGYEPAEMAARRDELLAGTELR